MGDYYLPNFNYRFGMSEAPAYKGGYGWTRFKNYFSLMRNVRKYDWWFFQHSLNDAKGGNSRRSGQNDWGPMGDSGDKDRAGFLSDGVSVDHEIWSPRAYRLRKEYNEVQKESDDDDGSIRLDLINPNDWTNWKAMIVGPADTNFCNKVYYLKITCGQMYPEDPPEVCFVSRINMTCVDSISGEVYSDKVPLLISWRREYTLKNVLQELRNLMTASENAKLDQPPEGSIFNNKY